MEYDIPVYSCNKGRYILIRDLKEEYERSELKRWVFGKLQPLLQGEKETIKDAVFFEDYMEFLKTKA